MRHGIKATLFTFVLGLPVLTLLPAMARAEGGARNLTASDVSVTIKGSSTLHGWQASAGSVSVTARLADAGDGLAQAVKAGQLAGLKLVLDVDSLKSTESSGMDKNMHRDLGSDQYPQIVFSLKSYTETGTAVTAKGDLAIHGVTKPVTLTGMLAPSGGALKLQGDYPLLMSDYGVQPPVMMFGTVKVADKVDIVYSFKLSE